MQDKRLFVNIVEKKLLSKNIKQKMVNIYFVLHNAEEIGIQRFGLNRKIGRKNQEFVPQKF